MKEEKKQEAVTGITFARGFYAAHTAAGIKYQGREDMAMIYSEIPCVTAGIYTTNVVKAAPVLWDREITDSDRPVRAVIINAGVANACTGQEGMTYCRQTAEAAAAALGIEAGEVLVASTGVIGMQLPMDRLLAGVGAMAPGLSRTGGAGGEAARAIMTTDTRPKEASATVRIGGKEIRIGGMCKGSGMIHPDMSTMLAFLATDCVIEKSLLRDLVREAADDTFHMISVDGDTSTNDTCLVLANGAAGNPCIHDRESEECAAFRGALTEVLSDLSQKIAGDGEGATALFEVCVRGARNKEEARILAKSVVTSTLTKAAIYGHDANWGRILCALGYAGVDFDPGRVSLWFESNLGRIRILRDGISTGYSEEEAGRILSAEKVTAVCDMAMGEAEATAWGCDLTHQYVSINADYRS